MTLTPFASTRLGTCSSAAGWMGAWMFGRLAKAVGVSAAGSPSPYLCSAELQGEQPQPGGAGGVGSSAGDDRSRG